MIVQFCKWPCGQHLPNSSAHMWKTPQLAALPGDTDSQSTGWLMTRVLIFTSGSVAPSHRIVLMCNTFGFPLLCCPTTAKLLVIERNMFFLMFCFALRCLVWYFFCSLCYLIKLSKLFVLNKRPCSHVKITGDKCFEFNLLSLFSS